MYTKVHEIHPSKTGPLFIHFEGQPLTRYQFIASLTRCLDIFGICSTSYDSHCSNYILVMQGVYDDVIQARGRWRSHVSYIYSLIYLCVCVFT